MPPINRELISITRKISVCLVPIEKLVMLMAASSPIISWNAHPVDWGKTNKVAQGNGAPCINENRGF